jgi:DNA-binding NtrC family response regulator
MGRKVLVVEDDAQLRRIVALLVRSAGGAPVEVATARDAIEQLPRVALALIDLQLSDHPLDRSGLDVVTAARDRGVPAVVVSSHYNLPDVHRAFSLGAKEFLVKVADEPSDPRAVSPQTIGKLVKRFCSSTKGVDALDGASPSMQELRELVRRYARSPHSVLITGERGTGKDLLARALHEESGRAGRFVALNAASLSPQLVESELFGHVAGAFTGAARGRAGAFVEANGGTLFLDEVGDMPVEQQAKLLRVLEDACVRAVGADRPETVDVRVIAATNRDLNALIAEGTFRADLRDRLSVLPLHAPPLRVRGREDIDALIAAFIAAECRDRSPLRLTAAAAAWLSAQRWPGNVRELLAAIRRLAAVADGVSEIDVAFLEETLAPVECHALSDDAAIYAAGAVECERVGWSTFCSRVMRAAADRADGNISAVARRVGAARKTVDRLARANCAEPQVDVRARRVS